MQGPSLMTQGNFLRFGNPALQNSQKKESHPFGNFQLASLFNYMQTALALSLKEKSSS
jgi:hypothetical protein